MVLLHCRHVSPVNGDWFLFSIGDWDGPIVVSTSADQGVSWIPGGDAQTVVSVYNNPGPMLHSNGSMSMFYRYETSSDDIVAAQQGATCSPERIGVQHCLNPDAPCAAGVNGAPVFAHTAEDPSVFRDGRGNWHMLLNALPWSCIPKDMQGGHAWSLDGVGWSEPRVGAYNTTVKFTDGSEMRCERRERPQMIMNTTQQQPLALVSGMVNCPPFGPIYKGGTDSFTLVQEMVQHA